jgi:enoyl-CoA hydratase/carnithine racemase
MDGESELLVERSGGVGELVINRRRRGNSITGPVAAAMHAGLDELLADPDIGAILLRGAGGLFCGGLDVEAFFGGGEAPPWRAAFADTWTGLHRALYLADKPLVVVLEGAAVAAGSALMLAGDFVVAEPDAVVHVLELERDLMAPVNLAWLLTRHSRAVTTKLVVGAQRVPAARLHALGLVDQVSAPGEALADARALAARLAGFDGELVRRTKAIVRGDSVAEFDAIVAAARARR